MNTSRYSLEYKGVFCSEVAWDFANGSVFYFTVDGRDYRFTQINEVHCNADTDHIRCVIEEQFLPWLQLSNATKYSATAEQAEVTKCYGQLLVGADNVAGALNRIVKGGRNKILHVIPIHQGTTTLILIVYERSEA